MQQKKPYINTRLNCSGSIVPFILIITSTCYFTHAPSSPIAQLTTPILYLNILKLQTPAVNLLKLRPNPS